MQLLNSHYSNFGRIFYRFRNMTFKAIENGLFSLPRPGLTPRSGEPVRISGWDLPCKNQTDGSTKWWKFHDPNINCFYWFTVWQTDGRAIEAR